MTNTAPSARPATHSREALRRENRILDPSDYYVPSPGKDGVPIAGRISPDQRHIISQVIEGGQTRFKTSNDFVRAAVTHFISEVFGGKFMAGKLDPAVKRMNDWVSKANRMTRLLDLEKFKYSSRDAITKYMAVGMVAEAVDDYRQMLTIAEDIHPKFGQKIAAWAESEPALAKVAALARQIEERGKPTETTPCDDCHHPLAKHLHEGALVECMARVGKAGKRCRCEAFAHEE